MKKENKIIKNIIFFDVDGVLNSGIDHEDKCYLIQKIKESETEEEKEKWNKKREESFPFLYVSIDDKNNNDDEVDGVYIQKETKLPAFGFVSAQKLKALQNIVKEYDVEMVGISSWFCANFEKNKKEMEKFFGFEIKDVVGMVFDADIRVNCVLKYLEENYSKTKLKQKKIDELNVIYLDDINDFTQKGVDTVRVLNHHYNTLFIHPLGRFGLEQSHFNMMKKWFSIL